MHDRLISVSEMLTRGELEALQDLLPFKNYDQILQDYIIEKALYHISSLWFEKTILIGGTALSKFYGVPRFSKDIDLIFKGINDENYPSIFDTIKERLIIEGFNVSDLGSPIKKGFWYFHTYEVSAPHLGRIGLIVEIRKYSDPVSYRVFEHVPRYPDIFEYRLKIASLEDILKEKINAIRDLARYQIRDLFDIYYITKKYGLDITKYVWAPEEFCRIAKSMLRYWESLKEILFVGLPPKRDVLSVLGCT